MSLAEKIAREVNREFIRRGANPNLLGEIFEEAFRRNSLDTEENERIRMDVREIARGLRLELLKKARGA